MLGFICSWPFFIDGTNGKLMLFEFNQMMVTVNSGESAPFPVGLITLSIFFIGVLFSSRRLVSIAIELLLLFLLFFIVFQGIGYLKLVALFVPFASIVMVKAAISINDDRLDYFTYGYICAAVSLYFLNVISFLYFSYTFGDFGNFIYGRQILNIEIYQFYVSYSAVSSLVFGVSVLLVFTAGRIFNKWRILLAILAIFSAIISVLAQRKAALLDFYFLGFLVALYMLRYISKGRVKSVFLVIPLIFMAIFLFDDTIRTDRNISVENAVEGRIGPYYMALTRLSFDDPIGLFFGFEGGFGGYSNILLELFIRGGIVGLFIYIFIIVSLSLKLLRKVKKTYNIERLPNRLALVFILFNLLVGNIANLNLTVPYYVTNLICIILLYLCFARQVSSRRRCENNYDFAVMSTNSELKRAFLPSGA